MAYNKRYKMDSSELRKTTGFGSGHPGIDLVGPVGSPLYAICDGIVVDAPIWKKTPTGSFGGLDSGTYAAVMADGNGLNDYLVDRVGHMSSLAVSVGQHVKDGDLLGYQGYTGYTIPSGPAGEHSHNAIHRVVDGSLEGQTYLDPTPFLEGASMIINPIPQPQEVSTVKAPINCTYLITDPEGLAIRTEPVAGAPLVKPGMQKGDVFLSDMLTDAVAGDGKRYTFARHARGWSVIGLADGSEIYVEAQSSAAGPSYPDLSGDLEVARSQLSNALDTVRNYTDRFAVIKGQCP